MAFSASSSSCCKSNSAGAKFCRCGIRAIVRMAWTELNAGRRFYGCSRFTRPGFCGFREWIDEPIPEHIVKMLLEYKKMKKNLGYERYSGQIVEAEEDSGEKQRFEQRMLGLEGDVSHMKIRYKLLLFVILGIILYVFVCRMG